MSLASVLIKTFRYGAIIRFLQLAGVRLWPATAATAALLGVIEIVQLRLPMHIAEITDVVVALVLGIAFWVIETDPWYRSEEKAKYEPDLRFSRTQ